MRYTIGIRIQKNDGNICEGVLAYNSLGLPFIATEQNLKDPKANDYIRIFDFFEDVQEEVRKLSKSYRKEFHQRAEQYNLDISNFRIFPLKFDSLKMKHIKLGRKQILKKQRKYKVYQIQKSE